LKWPFSRIESGRDFRCKRTGPELISFPPFRAIPHPGERMKTLSSLFAAAAICAWLSGCASISQSGYPDSTSNKGKKVTASLTHFSLLYLLPPDNLDKLMDDLSEQCGNAKVEGISWTDTRRYFYLFGVLYSLEVAGRCAE
jgi:hypothetical protein